MGIFGRKQETGKTLTEQMKQVLVPHLQASGGKYNIEELVYRSTTPPMFYSGAYIIVRKGTGEEVAILVEDKNGSLRPYKQ